MLICLDFDGTYTLDTDFWNNFINQASASGHIVICATMRHEETEGEVVKELLSGRVKYIYFTSRNAKKPFLAGLGIFPDIWIDDHPEWLLSNAK